MAVFIELTTDAFEANVKRLEERYAPAERAGLSNVRRPLRGIEIKEDTYAMIKVIRADGTEIPLADSSSSTGERKKTASFLLQSVTDARMEKHQIVETFGQAYLHLFGEAPRFLDVTAILMNSFDFNWEAEWWHNWDTRLRGTKSVEEGARVYLFYDDNIVEGYMLLAQAAKTCEQPYTVQLSWRMFVTNYRNISFVGDANFPVHASVNLPPNVSLTSADAFGSLVEAYRDDTRAADELAAFDDDLRTLTGQEFGTRRRLAEVLRRGSRSIAFAPDVQAFVDHLHKTNAQDIPERDVLDRLTSKPLRSKIADNRDEFTASSSLTGTEGLPEVFTPPFRSVQEASDLFVEAIRWMSCYGADIDNYTTLQKLGLGVNFRDSAGFGIGGNIGAGAGTTLGATFSAVPQAFGARATASATAGIETSAIDAEYGYASPFSGPGFGRAGFGELGGRGFGSGFGPTGDPGYLAPDKFSLAGVEDERGAFERFVRPQPSFGRGLGGIDAGASFASVGAGPGISVSGTPTAFAVVAVPGTLDPSAQSGPNLFGARSCADDISRVNVFDLL